MTSLRPIARVCGCSVRVAEFVDGRTVPVGVVVSAAHISVGTARLAADDRPASVRLLSPAVRRLPRLLAGVLANGRLLRRLDGRPPRRNVAQSSALQLQYATTCTMFSQQF